MKNDLFQTNTLSRKHDDPSANRFIMSFIVGHPFVRGDVEFLSLSVEGQSFMLHQIRKMIGLVIAVVRGYLTDDVICEAFKPEKVIINHSLVPLLIHFIYHLSI